MHHQEIHMKLVTLMRGATVALALTTVGGVAFAGGDIYSRLFEMREMDRNQDGMISKEEFLAMVSKAWDMKATEMKAKGRLTPEQFTELQKVLGRSIGAPTGI
jgi:hypothetical protein